MEMSRKSLSDVFTLLLLLLLPFPPLFDSQSEPHGRNVGFEVYFRNYFVTLIIYRGGNEKISPDGEVRLGQLIRARGRTRTGENQGENYGNLFAGSIFFHERWVPSGEKRAGVNNRETLYNAREYFFRETLGEYCRARRVFC